MPKKVRVMDIEANGLKATKVHCAVFSSLDEKQVDEFRPDQMDEMVEFMKTCDVLICHNIIGYDCPTINRVLGYEFKGIKIDTLLMSRMQKPDRQAPFGAKDKAQAAKSPHGLYSWGVRVGIDKPEYHEWDEFDEDMLHRCREDVRINVRVFKALMEEVKGQDWKQAHKLTFKLFEGLQKQEEYGWPVDLEYMDKCINLLTHWMDRIDRVVEPYLPLVVEVNETKTKGEYGYVKKPFKKNGDYSAVVYRWLDEFDDTHHVPNVAGPFTRISFRRPSLDSNDETKKFLLDWGWIPEVWNYKKDEKGKPAKDDRGNLIKTSPKLSHGEEFNGVNGNVGRLIARRVQCRHRRSQIEGWVKNVREDGRLESRVTGLATTGRMKHANIVNVPGGDAFFGKQMRKCFISSPGYVLVGCDSAGCQNRMLAARVGDDFFTRTLLEGRKEDGTSIHHVNQRAIKDVAGLEVTYHKAKTLNYAFMFGASDKKLAATVGSTNLEVGAAIRRALLSVAAGFEALVNNLTEEWRSNASVRINDWGKPQYYNGWITGLDGRPIYIESEHMILVYMLQSDEAIMMSLAYVLLRKKLRKKYAEGEDFRIVCFYHDEYTIEVKEELAEDVAKIAEQCIVDAGKFYKIACPHEGDASIGKDWWEIH